MRLMLHIAIVILCLGALCLAGPAFAAPQPADPPQAAPQPAEAPADSPAQPDYTALLSAMDADGAAVDALSGVTLARADYSVADAQGIARQAEALAFTPPAASAGAGPWPALLLIPGYGTSCRDWVPNGLAFAAAGYYCLAVTQPGFGASDGPADFAGPWTIAVLSEGFKRLRDNPQADPARLGLVGYSRGAMAAALLATRLPEIKAAVLGGGIYDMASAYNEIGSQLIRRNMLAETGSLRPEDIVVDAQGKASLSPDAALKPEAARERSALGELDQLTASVLILHGEADLNAPLSQAELLRDRLTELGKDFELVTFPGTPHGIGLANFQGRALEFLARKL